MIVLLLCYVCTIDHIAVMHPMTHVVLHLENFVIVECVGFHLVSLSLFVVHVILVL